MQNQIRVKVYVRPSSWDVYIVAPDEYGATIAVTANKGSMDAVIYNLGWESARDSWIEEGASVSVHHIATDVHQ